MSNQLQITGGAKVRSLEGVITGTSGVLSSVPLGGANGVATLDSGGKVPVSQLPSSVVTYLGTWDAATNTPTLTNGTGDAGDMYICNVAGTVNFGAGPITFAVGDWVLYGSGTWQKSNGQNGTVTSVGLTAGGNALTITNSPITTAGNINVGFAGSSTQYIAGDGTLVTFPTIITEAQTLITDVYNETGATLTKGTVVYINGGHGNLPTVTKALATSDATSAQTYGVVQADITNNNNGHVVVIGSLGDLDTQAYAAGTQLYLSSTTAGAWTSTKQYAPEHLVYVGIVTRSHPTQGVVEIKIQNGYELDELHNVSAQFPSNNDGLFYNSSNSLWENKSIATALGYTPADDSLVVKLAGAQTITGAKTFSATTLLNTIYVDGVSYLKNQTTTSYIAGYTTFSAKANGVIEYYFPSSFKSILDFNDSGDYTYTYPTITGTLALLEGTQTFSGAKTFTDNTIFSASPLFDQSANYKVGASLVGTGNYIAMAFDKSGTGSGSILSMKLADGTTAKAINLDFLGSPATYTYTFPALTGTLALLEGTQTFTGAKTFSSLLTADSSLLLKNGVFAIASGYTNLAGNNLNNGLVVQFYGSGGTAITNNLNFNATTGYNYTFPSASGTLALTSNLSSYVPYTGATADVNLGTTYSLSANNITAAGVVKSDFGLQLKSGLTTTISGYLSISAQKVSTNSQLNVYTDTGFYFSLIAPNTANYSYTFPASNGTIVLGTGTTNYLPKFTGASTIGNSLIFDNGTNLGIGTSGTTYASTTLLLRATSATSTNYSFIVEDNATNQLFAIRNTGAATFSSSVTATNLGINVSSIYGKFEIAGTATNYSTAPAITFTDTTGDANSNRWIVGNIATDYGSFNIASAPTPSSTTWTPRITILKGGNVGIGTSSPVSKLQVSMDALYNNSDYTGLSVSNATTILKRLDMGYDGSADIAYIQSIHKGTAYKNLAINANGGNVGIGTHNPQAHRLAIAGPSSLVDARSGVYIYSTDSMGANLGGQLFFGGSYTGTSETFWASIAGRKENATDNNVAGYLAFATRPAGGSNTERMRITSGGAVNVNSTQTSDRFSVTGSNNSTSIGLQGAGLVRTYYASAGTGTTYDAFRFLTESGGLYKQGGICGYLYMNFQDSGTGGNQVSYVYLIITTGNGVSPGPTNFTQISAGTVRGNNPVSSISLVNDGTGGGVKVQVTSASSGISGIIGWITFVGTAV